MHSHYLLSPMARFLRRLLAKALPANAKGRLRDLWSTCTIHNPPVPLDVEAHSVPGQVYAKVGSLPPIILTESVLPDLRLHCESSEHAGEMMAFVEACSRPGVLIDVGAHNGFFSLLYASCNEVNRVLAFEPSDSLRPRASHLAAINQVGDRIEFSPCVVAERCGSVSFFSDASSGFVQPQAFPGNEEAGFRPVTLGATTLDEACISRRLAPTLLKVDVEGYELEVLQGAKRTLESHRPTVFLELHLNYLEQRGLDPRNVVQLLEACGYSFSGENGRHVAASALVRSWKSVVRLVARHTLGCSGH